MLKQEIAGIEAAVQRCYADIQVLLEEELYTPVTGLLSGCVRVKDQDHALGVPSQKLDVFSGQGGAEGGDDIGDAELVRHEDIRVSLDHDSGPPLSDRAFGFVQPIEAGALVEEDGLRRIEVLRAFSISEHSGAETNGAVPHVPDREHDSAAEPVVVAVPLGRLAGEARLLHEVGAYSLVLEETRQAVP